MLIMTELNIFDKKFRDSQVEKRLIICDSNQIQICHIQIQGKDNSTLELFVVISAKKF